MTDVDDLKAQLAASERARTCLMSDLTQARSEWKAFETMAWADKKTIRDFERDRLTLRQALQRYGQHEDNCPVAKGYLSDVCTCGFLEALHEDLARVGSQPDSTLALPQPKPDGDHR